MLAGLILPCLFHCLPVAGDMVTTELALREPGLRESHISQRGPRLAANLGIAAGSVWLDRKLEKRSKPLMWGFRAARVALGVLIVRHNWREIEKAQVLRHSR